MIHYSDTAVCRAWGSQKNARRVSHVSPEDIAAMHAGYEVRLRDCPPVHGQTERVIIKINDRYYTRMPLV